MAGGAAIAAAIAAIILFSAAGAGASAANVQSGKEMRFIVEDADAAVGGLLYVPISIESNPGVYGFDILVRCDSACIRFEGSSMAAGFLNDGYVSETSGGAIRIYFENEELAENTISGEVAVLHFTALKQSVSYVRISIGPGGAWSMDPYGEIGVSFTDGKISVTGSGNGGGDGGGGDGGNGGLPGGGGGGENGGGTPPPRNDYTLSIIAALSAVIIVAVASAYAVKKRNR